MGLSVALRLDFRPYQVRRGESMAGLAGMRGRQIGRWLPLVLIFLLGGCAGSRGVGGIYNAEPFGPTGDGTTLDTDGVNEAITAANRDGGGTVRFPAGMYRCYSIHLKSNVTLY